MTKLRNQTQNKSKDSIMTIIVENCKKYYYLNCLNTVQLSSKYLLSL